MRDMRGGLLADYVLVQRKMTDGKAVKFFRYLLRGLEIIDEAASSPCLISPYTIWVDGDRPVLDCFNTAPAFTQRHTSATPVDHYRMDEFLAGASSFGGRVCSEREKRAIRNLYSLGLVLYFMAAKKSSADDSHPPRMKEVNDRTVGQLCSRVASKEISDILSRVFSAPDPDPRKPVLHTKMHALGVQPAVSAHPANN
jgi:hypothetical protein